MTHSVSFDASMKIKRSESKYANRPVALWALTIVLVAIACTVPVLTPSWRSSASRCLRSRECSPKHSATNPFALFDAF